jgi:phosphoribosylaminoimidazole-succinocarboxamide synthase
MTPDSSRFWPKESYRPGQDQPSFDKQFVREYLESLDWDKTPPGPELPPDVVAGTRARYLEAYRLLTAERYDSPRRDPISWARAATDGKCARERSTT